MEIGSSRDGGRDFRTGRLLDGTVEQVDYSVADNDCFLKLAV